MPTTAFLTDATICIGCKACEVACKEWNEVPEDGYVWSGLSYDNTKALGASTWRHVLFLEQPVAGGTAGRGYGGSVSLGVFVGCVQALRECGMSGGLPDGFDCADGVWRRVCAERYLQRVRILRGVVSVWCDRQEVSRRWARV